MSYLLIGKWENGNCKDVQRVTSPGEIPSLMEILLAHQDLFPSDLEPFRILFALDDLCEHGSKEYTPRIEAIAQLLMSKKCESLDDIVGFRNEKLEEIGKRYYTDGLGAFDKISVKDKIWVVENLIRPSLSSVRDILKEENGLMELGLS